MEEVKLTKAHEILFEVYDKGVQNQDCNLDEYVEKMKQALSIADVSQQRELLKYFYAYVDDKWALGMLTDEVDEVIDGFEKRL